MPIDVAKGLLRAVCECVYSLPRDFRGQFNDIIDWRSDSVWYQIEFFGALMASDKAIQAYKTQEYHFQGSKEGPLYMPSTPLFLWMRPCLLSVVF